MNIKTRRLGLALAAASATLALSGIGAGGAQAALPGHCAGDSDIAGVGSSLQNSAQTIWKNAFGTEAGSTVGGCLGKTVTYTASSSGGCLAAFGATGLAVNTAVHFCGTDDAPDESQITTANTTLGSTLLTVPVAQSAIALVANLPAGCTVDSITPEEVSTVWKGSLTTWSQLEDITQHTTNACNVHFMRVVRDDNSGTTYQFKHYLTTLDASAVHGTLSWKDLQSLPNNTTWPGTVTKTTSGCNATMTLPCPGTGSGGGDEVRTVGATVGGIGYAALSDAREVRAATGGTWTGLTWLKVRVSNGLGGSVNVDPSTNGVSSTTATSNCNTADNRYDIPTGGITGDWSQTYYTAQAGDYPLCTLTWDLASATYAPKWGATGTGYAQTVKDYLHYILTGGQTALGENDYAALSMGIVTNATAGLSDIHD